MPKPNNRSRKEEKERKENKNRGGIDKNKPPDRYKLKDLTRKITDPYTAIGKLQVTFSTTQGASRTTTGTAFLIAQSVVLTAAHVLRPKEKETFDGAAVQFGKQTYRVANYECHQDYKGSGSDMMNDIAIAKLERPLRGKLPDIKPMTLTYLGGKRGIEEGTPRLMAGFTLSGQDKFLVSRQPLQAWPNKSMTRGGPLTFPKGSTTEGMSGGPVFSDRTVYGIIHGLDKSRDRDVAAPLDEKAKTFIEKFH